MDDERHTPLGGRLLAVVALATITGATALAFSRVFTQGAALKLVFAAWLAIAVGVLLERRGLWLATVAAGGILILSIAWFVFPDTLWFGLPTSETFGRAGKALAQVGPQARRQVSPTAPIAPLLLASITAVSAAAFSAHALAVRAASPALALAPSVALIAFADAALRGEGTLPFAALFLGGAVLLLLADGVRRIREWGPVHTRGTPDPHDADPQDTIDAGPRARSAGALARRAGGAAALTLAIAVLAPGLLPGYGGEGLIAVRSSASGDPNLDPLVSIGDSLNRETPVKLFRVESDEPTYWRLLSLDTFDGTTWRADDLQAFDGMDLQSGSALPVNPPAGATPSRQSFTVIDDLGFTWVPAAYPTTSLDLGGTSFKFDPDLGTIVAPEPLAGGTEYTAASLLPAPSPEELKLEPGADPGLEQRYVALPSDVPTVVENTAAAWTQGLSTDYERAFEIQERLRSPTSGFRYDDGYETPDGRDPLVDFLSQSKRGFCQQFAGTMAVMLRSIGIPARVAVGFTTGVAIGVGRYEVSTDNAHAWVEVFFPNYGWLAFEPTPSRDNLAAASYLAPTTLTPCTGRNCETGPRRGDRGTRSGAGGTGDRARPRADRIANDAPLPPAPLPEPSWRRYVAPTLGLVALFLAIGLALVPPAKALRRQVRLARARTKDPRELVLATYDVFAARAGDLGLRRQPNETFEEFGARVRLAAAPTGGPRRANASDDLGLRSLTTLAERAAFGAGPVQPQEARHARRSARSALHDLRKRRGRLRHLGSVWRRGL
ncbi:MAG: DUF3488 and transglutaminase-like domain-containing protein [Actinomycetota bacterium]